MAVRQYTRETERLELESESLEPGYEATESQAGWIWERLYRFGRGIYNWFVPSGATLAQEAVAQTYSEQLSPQILKKAGMIFAGTIGKEVVNNLWKMCEGPPTQDNTLLKDTNVFISNCIAKEFGDSNNLSEWVQDLNKEMAIACCKAIEAIKAEKKRNGAQNLTWQSIVSIFSNCDYIISDVPKNISTSKALSELRFYSVGQSEIQTRELLIWIQDIFNQRGERDVLDNSMIVMSGTIDRLAGIASTYGVAVRSLSSLIADTREQREKVMEVGVIRFPRKGNAKIKVYRMEIFAFMKSCRILPVQYDQGGLQIEYNSIEFKVNSVVIDTIHAERAKAKLRDPATFDF